MQRRQATAALLSAVVPACLSHPSAMAGKWLPSPDIPQVRLNDHAGRTVDLGALVSGRIVVVNFFFTGCATVCPPQTALLRQARQIWLQRPALRGALVVSISVDALGDGPQQLRTYAERFQLPLGADQGWVLLSGAATPLSKVLAAFDVPAGVPDDHPALLWLGDGVRGRWTRASALNAPATTVQLLEELVS